LKYHNIMNIKYILSFPGENEVTVEL